MKALDQVTSLTVRSDNYIHMSSKPSIQIQFVSMCMLRHQLTVTHI